MQATPKSPFVLRYFLIVILFICFCWALLKPLIDELQRLPAKIVDPITAKPVIVKPIEIPLHQVALPNFAAIRDVKDKKRQFFNFLAPTITAENNRLLKLRGQMLTLLEKISLEQPLSSAEQLQIKELAKSYRITGSASQLQLVHELTKRIDIVPSQLILVQAANESAWGTSRFARIGLNFFGIWCYKKGCGMVPSARNAGAKHEVAAFKSVSAAVRHYLHNINTNHAYQVLRNIRLHLREQNQPLSPQILATGLLAYSERGADYVHEITQMLRQNKDYF